MLVTLLFGVWFLVGLIFYNFLHLGPLKFGLFGRNLWVEGDVYKTCVKKRLIL